MQDSVGKTFKVVIDITCGKSEYYTTTRNIVVIKADGTVGVAGANTYGQFGNRNNTSSLYLTQIGETTVKLYTRNEYIKVDDTLDIDVLEAGEFNVFIPEQIDQSDWTWKSSNEKVATVDNDGIVTGKGIGHTTITGYGPNGLKARAIVNVYRNKKGAITVPQVVNGQEFSIILKEDGTVWTTGRNNCGQLGHCLLYTSPRPRDLST